MILLKWQAHDNEKIRNHFGITKAEEENMRIDKLIAKVDDLYNRVKKETKTIETHKTERAFKIRNRLAKLIDSAAFFEEQLTNNIDKDTWFIEWQLEDIYKEQAQLVKQLKFLVDKSPNKKEVPMEEIRQVPIEELIPYGKTKHHKSPTEFTILCPAHTDTHPSCSINTEKNVWHCFSCQAGGTNIGYVMAEQNLTASEATKKIINLIK